MYIYELLVTYVRIYFKMHIVLLYITLFHFYSWYLYQIGISTLVTFKTKYHNKLECEANIRSLILHVRHDLVINNYFL